jgi:hypothetical protein
MPFIFNNGFEGNLLAFNLEGIKMDVFVIIRLETMRLSDAKNFLNVFF